jgi:hypothetical protein
MCEACFCGWSGELADHVLVQLESGEGGLACPQCGRVDTLAWLSPDQRQALLASVRQRPHTVDLTACVAA